MKAARLSELSEVADARIHRQPHLDALEREDRIARVVELFVPAARGLEGAGSSFAAGSNAGLHDIGRVVGEIVEPVNAAAAGLASL